MGSQTEGSDGAKDIAAAEDVTVAEDFVRAANFASNVAEDFVGATNSVSTIAGASSERHLASALINSVLCFRRQLHGEKAVGIPRMEAEDHERLLDQEVRKDHLQGGASSSLRALHSDPGITDAAGNSATDSAAANHKKGKHSGSELQQQDSSSRPREGTHPRSTRTCPARARHQVTPRLPAAAHSRPEEDLCDQDERSEMLAPSQWLRVRQPAVGVLREDGSGQHLRGLWLRAVPYLRKQVQRRGVVCGGGLCALPDEAWSQHVHAAPEGAEGKADGA